MPKGLVSGVCIDIEKGTIIVVPDLERPGRKYGLPGGKIEDDQTADSAVVAEWNEEVGLVSAYQTFQLLFSRERKGDNGLFLHYFYRVFYDVNISNELRKTGITGETGAPEWVPIVDLFSGKIQMHYSHLAGLAECLHKIAMEDINVAFLVQSAKVCKWQNEIHR